MPRKPGSLKRKIAIANKLVRHQVLYDPRKNDKPCSRCNICHKGSHIFYENCREASPSVIFISDSQLASVPMLMPTPKCHVHFVCDVIVGGGFKDIKKLYDYWSSNLPNSKYVINVGINCLNLSYDQLKTNYLDFGNIAQNLYFVPILKAPKFKYLFQLIYKLNEFIIETLNKGENVLDLNNVTQNCSSKFDRKGIHLSLEGKHILAKKLIEVIQLLGSSSSK